MTHATRLLLIGTAIVFLNCGRADAGVIVWDWLERWSGPGPFWGTNLIVTVCPSYTRPTTTRGGDGSISWLGTRADTNPKKPCLYVDTRELAAHQNDNFPAVTASWVESGATFQLKPWLEIGTGIGFVHVVAGRKDPAQDDLFTKNVFIVTVPRITVKPLRIWWPNSKWSGIVKPYYKNSILTGELKGSDFGVHNDYHANNERVSSLGILVDLGELLR